MDLFARVKAELHRGQAGFLTIELAADSWFPVSYFRAAIVENVKHRANSFFMNSTL